MPGTTTGIDIRSGQRKSDFTGEKHLAKIMREKQNEQGENLDSAMIKAVREQAGKKSFIFE